jgi:hypothetical protein
MSRPIITQIPLRIRIRQLARIPLSPCVSRSVENSPLARATLPCDAGFRGGKALDIGRFVHELVYPHG